jgi:hypothetical protein
MHGEFSKPSLVDQPFLLRETPTNPQRHRLAGHDPSRWIFHQVARYEHAPAEYLEEHTEVGVEMNDAGDWDQVISVVSHMTDVRIISGPASEASSAESAPPCRFPATPLRIVQTRVARRDRGVK